MDPSPRGCGSRRLHRCDSVSDAAPIIGSYDGLVLDLETTWNRAGRHHEDATILAALVAFLGYLLTGDVDTENTEPSELVHAPGGREIEVGLVRQEGRARLTVRDHGSGLPPDQRERVFDRFYRIPGTAGDGSGLGLAIVAEIVRRKGGVARIGDPAEGHGLEVVVELPLAAPVGSG